MKYFLVIQTEPQNVLPLSEVLLFRAAIQPQLGSSDIHKLKGLDDADIDAQTVADLIAEGRFSESEFTSYCEAFGVPAHRADGDFNYIASQGFLDRQCGQEIMSLALPTDDSAIEVYAALVEFARKHKFRLWSPMPHDPSDVDLDSPGQLPPHWEQYVS